MLKKRILETVPVPDHDARLKLSARVQRVEISGKPHLLVDIFEYNEWKHRVALNKDEHSTYNVRYQHWENHTIDSWKSTVPAGGINVSDKEKKKAKVFCKSKPDKAHSLRQIIYWHQIKIDTAKAEVKSKKKKDTKQQLFDLLTPADIEEINEKIRQRAWSNIICYKRHNKYSEYQCCQCGKKYTRINDPYEPSYEPVPAADEKETCKNCGTIGRLKPIGRYKGTYGGSMYTVKWESHEGYLVARGFYTSYIRLCGQPMNISTRETYRLFTRLGETHEYAYYWGYGEGWREGYDDRPGNRAEYGFDEALSQSELKYYPKGIEYLMHDAGITQRLQCVRAYANAPQLETLYKIGFVDICRHIIWKDGHTRLIDKKSTKAAEILRCNAEEFKWVCEDKTHTVDRLETLNNIKYLNLTLKDADRICEIKRKSLLSVAEIKLLLDYQSPEKLINYIEKQVGKNKYFSHSEAYREYKDYLRQRKAQGVELTNSVYLRPKNLKAKYAQIRAEEEAKRNKEYASKMALKFPDIPKFSKKIPKKYTYSTDELMIRPAADAPEIVNEGKTLHHCVGSEAQSYMSNFNQNKGWIFVLRRVNKPNEPYITLEFKDGRIKQWYGAYDKKPDQEEIEAFLDDWLKHLKIKKEKKIA